MNKPTAAIFPLVKELDPVAAMADNEREALGRGLPRLMKYPPGPEK